MRRLGDIMFEHWRETTALIRLIHIAIGVIIACVFYFHFFPLAEEGLASPAPTYGKIGVSALSGYFFAVFLSFFTKYPTKVSGFAAQWLDKALGHGLFCYIFYGTIFLICACISFPVVMITYPFETFFAFKAAIYEIKHK